MKQSALFLVLTIAFITPEVAFAQSLGEGVLQGMMDLLGGNGGLALGGFVALLGLIKWIFYSNKIGFWMILGGLILMSIPTWFGTGQNIFNQAFGRVGITTHSGILQNLPTNNNAVQQQRAPVRMRSAAPHGGRISGHPE